jgi:hypothetical protein
VKLGEDGAHHLAASAADFIDVLRDEYGEDADLTGFVVIAEISDPNEAEGTSLVRWEHDTTWAHAAGLAWAASQGLCGLASSDE